jgi:hypothetical protein
MKRTFTFGLVAAVGLAVAAGCDNKPTTTTVPKTGGTTTAKEKGEGHEDHDHGAGPHGGAIGEFGGKYHFEFTVNHKTQEATVYILGANAKTAAPIKAATLLLAIDKPLFRVDLKPAPQEGDPPGTSSRFVGKHEKLGVEQEFSGEVSGDVDGKPLAGEFEEKAEKK